MEKAKFNILWQASEETKKKSNVIQYMHWLSQNYHLHFDDYHSLWLWSVTSTKPFWKSIWKYFEISPEQNYNDVHSDDPMPFTKWFEGTSLNYAEYIFRNKTDEHPAIIFKSERDPLVEIGWIELESKVANLSGWMREHGVRAGDRVAAYIPNIPEATVAFLASISLGAIWSSCSPDFGSNSVTDRFVQIKPKLLFTVDGYQYNGKHFNKTTVVKEIVAKLDSLEKVIIVPYLDRTCQPFLDNSFLWQDAISNRGVVLDFEIVPFDHPIWILYSSGTTGTPKAITHSHGGVLLEHLKYLAFHNDVHPGERFFWYSTTGWMMWNFVQASLLLGASIVLYDGSPGFPDIKVLWKLAEDAKINHFGTSAPYLIACMKSGILPKRDFDLSSIKSLSSTGSPLPPEAFDWVYEKIGKDIWLCSMSGGTDVCTAFVGGIPIEPVYRGEIQCRALGCAMFSFDEMGISITGSVGEMVITKPMPSMPIYFWNDPDHKRYLSSYFEMYPGGIWRHGDWLEITEHNGLIISGRSDATLNRHGIRIGTAEIYRSVNKIDGIKDSLVVNLELSGGRHYMPLFILLEKGIAYDESLTRKINSILRSDYTSRHVPDEIIEVPDIPYTISGKKLEAPVKKILMGMKVEKAANRGAMRNPESLDFYLQFRDRITDLK